MTGSTKRLLVLVTCAALILAVLAYVRVLMRGELHDKYVYSAMGAAMENVRIPPLKAYESPGGYLLYALPARSRGRASAHDYYEHLQLVALDSLCSDDQVCVSDIDKQIDVRCSQLEGILEDRRVLDKVKAYLKSNCTNGR
jgi:hypothetical protein